MSQYVPPTPQEMKALLKRVFCLRRMQLSFLVFLNAIFLIKCRMLNLFVVKSGID